MALPHERKVSISIEPKSLGQIQSVASRARNLGMIVEEILPDKGTIIGLIDSSKIREFYMIEEIHHIMEIYDTERKSKNPMSE